jgi:hypothetical protein
MTRTRKSWLTQNINRCEALLTELYLERDARAERQMQPPQVVERMRKMEGSVYARRRYENKIVKDPALLEAHRRRSREGWQRKQAEKKAETQTKQAEQRTEKQVDAALSFTLFV